MSAPNSFSTHGEHQYRLPVVTEQMPPRMAALERASRTAGTEYVELEPFREAFARKQRHGLDVSTVARRMGVDRERVAVLLGVKHRAVKRRVLKSGEVVTYRDRQQRVTYDVGVKLCRALGGDPVDFNV